MVACSRSSRASSVPPILDASLRGSVQPAQHIQQSGFSAAGGADDGGELPPFDLQIHAVQGADLGVAGAVILFKANGL